MEPQLRQLGLPTALKKGIVTLTQQYRVCSKGQTLSPEQARILKLFGHKMAAFHISIEGIWSNNGTYKVLKHDRKDHFVASKVKLKARKKQSEDDDDEDLGFEATVGSDDDDDDDEGAVGGGSGIDDE